MSVRADEIRKSYVADVDRQIASWMRLAAGVIGFVFLCTGTATLLFAEEDRAWLVGARVGGASACFFGFWLLGRPEARRYQLWVIGVTSVLATAGLGAICWRSGGIDSMFVSSAVLLYMMLMLAPTYRWLFLPMAGVFLVAMDSAARLGDPAVPWLTIGIKNIYHVATIATFIVGGVLLDRFRYRAFAAQYRLRQFLPAAVADGVVEGTVAPQTGFQRRKVTVLFADLVAFTDLSDSLEPEEMSELLNEYLSDMSAVAVEHGGTVDKFVGDAIMVLFGAPREADEATQSMAAASAALAMQQRVVALSEAWRDRGLARALQMRIGINTGYCTVGVFGSEQLKSYTAVGTPVNVAARLQAEAAPGTVLCSFATHGPIRDQVDAIPRGELSLRGVSHAVQAFEVTAIRS